MKRPSLYILQIALPLLAFSTFFLCERAEADSVIRIIGDRTTKAPDNSGGPMTAAPLPSSVRGSTIRIIGDKPSTAMTPTGEKAAGSALSQTASPIKEIRIIGDNIETVPKKAPEETAEQQLAQRLTALKAEEERKAAEKAEQERLEQLKAEQENEAARQAAIKQDQDQLVARQEEETRKAAETAEQERLAKIKSAQEEAHKAAERTEQERLANEKIAQEKAAVAAEESRKAAEKAEQARIAALRADEERLAAARRALADKSRQETEKPTQQTAPATPAAEFRTTPIDSPDTATNQIVVDDNKTGPATATIWDLYLSAKANDPALGRSESRVAGSKADSDLVFSGLMPHVDSRAGIQQISQSLSNYNTTDTNNDFTALNYNVTARLTLLSVPTLYSMSAAAAGLSGEQAGVAAARQNLIVKFTDSYFSVLKAQADKHIARGEINRLKQVLDQSQAFLRTGTGDIIAVYEAQSRLDGAAADLTRSESTLRLAEQKLSTVVGKPVTAIVNYLPQQPTGPDPDNLDWWVATMEKEQPAVRQAREALTQTSEQLKSAKAEYLPVLQASGGYDVNRGTAALPTAEVRQWFVGATISLPLYSGGETSAKVRRAVASDEERRHIFDETMDQQRENVKQAFFNLRYNISYIKALEQKKASAEIQLAAVSKGRNIGTRNAIDVLNAEQAYSVALRDYKYALYDNFIRVIQLKSAAGTLGDEDVSEVSKAVAPTIISSFRPTFR